jgi:Purple acid Phosphatase, N-terminal domain
VVPSSGFAPLLAAGRPIGAGAAIAGPVLLTGTAAASTRPAAARRPTPTLLTRADGPNGSAVAPMGRHIAYGADPPPQMAVGWQVQAPVSNPFIRIGPSPYDLSGQIPAEIRTVTTPASIWNTSTAEPDDSIPPSLAAATIEQYYLHATLTGLRPGQTYYYSVGHQGWDFSGNASALGTFTTAPVGRAPFRFTAFGDQGWSYDSVGTTTQVRTQNPAFHLHAGDISYAENGGDGLLTDQYDPRVWDSWFNLVEPAAGSLPWQVAVGNHEMEVWYSADAYGAMRSRQISATRAALRSPG